VSGFYRSSLVTGQAITRRSWAPILVGYGTWFSAQTCLTKLIHRQGRISRRHFRRRTVVQFDLKYYVHMIWVIKALLLHTKVWQNWSKFGVYVMLSRQLTYLRSCTESPGNCTACSPVHPEPPVPPSLPLPARAGR